MHTYPLTSTSLWATVHEMGVHDGKLVVHWLVVGVSQLRMTDGFIYLFI